MTAHSCLLCGGPVKVKRVRGESVVWDLCDPCNGVFAASAERVAARLVPVIDGPTGAAVVHMVGQLELEDAIAEGARATCGVCGRGIYRRPGLPWLHEEDQLTAAAAPHAPTP